MALYLVQHGIAVDKTVDPDRPLSEQGRQAASKMADHLAAHKVGIDQIHHSGKTRAEQTAAIFAQALKPGNVEAQDLLNPNDDVEAIIPHLQDRCMYVGHLPHLQKLVARLLCGDPDTPIVSFENAAVVCLSQNEQGHTLDWLLKPSML